VRHFIVPIAATNAPLDHDESWAVTIGGNCAVGRLARSAIAASAVVEIDCQERITSMTYPNGRVLTYGYNSGTDDAVGRVSYLADADDTHLADYTYLGVSTILGVSYSEAGIAYGLDHMTSGQYDRLDQFGRVQNAVWTGSGGNVVALNYGYDAAGNHVYRQDAVAGGSNNLDEVYAYDGLNQLQTMQRGHWDNGNPLTGTFVPDTSGLSQSWTLDCRSARRPVVRPDLVSVPNVLPEAHAAQGESQDNRAEAGSQGSRVVAVRVASRSGILGILPSPYTTVDLSA
jgi:hypothetical protein